MKTIKFTLLSVFIALTFALSGQTISITNPVLTPPYQVATGTAVTFLWDAWSTPPDAIFTFNQAPVIWQGIPPEITWTQHTNFTSNGDGTYSITLNINSSTWIWGGYDSMIGWQYSNDIEIQTVSMYVITVSSDLICSTNDTVVFTAPADTSYMYQWYADMMAVSGANDSIYYATSAGSYYCGITIDTTVYVTNTITITNYEGTFSGALNGSNITLTADQSFVSYQWYEGTQPGLLTPIAGATSNQYTTAITSITKYYSFDGTTAGGCTVSSPERAVLDSLFTTPVATLNATFNGQGYICQGTSVSIEASGNPGSFSWYNNGSYYSSGTFLNIYGPYQNGVYYVEVECLNWPEISIASDSVIVDILQLITPSITGANYYGKFCPGETIPMILTDEGYNYTWYVHDTMNVYTASNIISVPSGAYQHVFTDKVYVTVEGEYNGCIAKTTKTLDTWANQFLSISIDNYDQEYLCEDSTVNLLVPSWSAGDYQSFQWYENVAGNWITSPGDTLLSYNVSQPGEYKVVAVPNVCASVEVNSSSKFVYSYLDREPYIYANQTELCKGDTTILNMSGASSWFALQWLEAEVVIGSGGYEREFIGMINNSGTSTQEVFEYSAYRVSAKHNTCPNGLKTKSNIVFIKPSLNPEIQMITPILESNMHIITWDSTRHYLGCQDEPVELTLNNLNYSSISWHELLYAGDDDYEIGTQFSTQDTVDYLMDVYWITAVVEDANGCKGQSTPILLDSYAFQSPVIASYNNSDLCGTGDSTLMHLGFPGDWVSYQWYNDGVPIPNSNNDTLWATSPGMHTVTAFPALCPSFGYSSGLGPTVNYLYAEIMESTTDIYASPFNGYYTYQWFFNGDSVDAPLPATPWIFPKDSLENGIYTVSISNENCTKLSAGYEWSSIGMKENFEAAVRVFPNPTKAILTIEASSIEGITSISLIDLEGREVSRLENLSYQTISISHLVPGIYILRIETKTGTPKFIQISKQ